MGKFVGTSSMNILFDHSYVNNCVSRFLREYSLYSFAYSFPRVNVGTHVENIANEV